MIKFSNFPLSELQQITDALVDQSSKELYNITKSAGFMIDMGGSKGKVFTPLADVYNSFLDDAITGMVNGAYDYNTLVKRMVSRMTGSGLRTDHAFKTENGGDWGIDYASGWEPTFSRSLGVPAPARPTRSGRGGSTPRRSWPASAAWGPVWDSAAGTVTTATTPSFLV